MEIDLTKVRTMKNTILNFLRRAVGTSRLLEKLSEIKSGQDQLLSTFRVALPKAALTEPSKRFPFSQTENPLPLQNWWDPSYWEPTVSLAIRDICRPGNVVFDVGANAGGLSMMMSRLVGPRGIVCAFEASPRIIDKTHFNLVNAGCHNVSLYHKAIWHSTGSLVHLEAGDHLNDRIVEGKTSLGVRTVSLDDFCEAAGLFPSFVKMDIEGAEFDALCGGRRLLDSARPALVLEQSPSDMRCHALLTSLNYQAIDLSTYRPITTEADFEPGVGIANLLYLPSERCKSSPYFGDAPSTVVHQLIASDFETNERGNISLREPVLLNPGRYIISAKFEANGTDNEIFAGVETDNQIMLRYHTYTKLMSESYTNWVIQLDHPSAVTPFLRYLNGKDETLRWYGAEIVRLHNFDNISPPVVE